MNAIVGVLTNNKTGWYWFKGELRLLVIRPTMARELVFIFTNAVVGVLTNNERVGFIQRLSFGCWP